MQWSKNIHWPLLLTVFCLASLGMLSVYSAVQFESKAFALKQCLWVAFGIVVIFVMTHLNYRIFVGSSYLLYGIAILLLLGVVFFGQVRYGAKRWLDLGFFLFQPSEFAKLATILALANLLGSEEKWKKEGRVLGMAMVIIAIPLFLIVQQPDLGTAMLFIPTVIAILLLWGIKYRYLVGSFILGLICIPFFWFLLKEYQKKRILVFLNPQLDPLGAGYTALQSKIAVGSGGLWGKGFLQGTQGRLNFIPEHHTDFIFCIIGEEWGYLGAIILLVLYGFLFKACFYVIENTTDLKAKLLGVGVTTLLFAQVFVNIGMSFGLMPITGITLPFVSYGGSSFLMTSIGIGLILSIYRQRSIF